MVLRTCLLAAMAGLIALAGISRDASATITITLEWGACSGFCIGVGTPIIVFPGGGQTLRLDVYLTHDEVSGLAAHTFSLNFDTTPTDNELNLTPGMAPLEWAGTDVDPGPGVELYAPITAGTHGTVESTASVTGRINSFESVSFGLPLPRNGAAYTVGTWTATAPARYRVAQVFFTTTPAWDDSGADVFAGAFNGLADVSANGNFEAFPPGPINFGTATVYLPEPGTVSLLGLGLLGLALADRRARRS
jgi:hypothetical protein